MSRHDSRVLALQALYESDATGHNADEALARHLSEGSYGDKVREHAVDVVDGVARNRQSLDDVIGRFATEYAVDQLSAIDRNILRMALYESSHVEVPLRVLVNEAVELAKEFGSDGSARFVNGVLGAALTL